MRLDADLALIGSMRAAIEAAAWRSALNPSRRWRPGRPLELLLVGYNGSRNTGADVRVAEMVRRLRHLLGEPLAGLTVTTLDPALTRDEFPGARQLHVPKGRFPLTLSRAVHRADAVLACEGSMFKSKFANALSVMMSGGMGLALAEGKPAIGYGGEAGKMDAALRAFVESSCADALVLARTRPSLALVEALGIRSELGTDTAWTAEVEPSLGLAQLRAAGWDGRAPVLTLCPINPFWWPVRPELAKAGIHALTGRFADSHRSAVYFHRAGAEVEAAQRRYIEQLARAASVHAERHGAFVAIVGMEALDRKACEALAAAIPGGAPCFVSDLYRWPTLVSLLRASSWIVTSRYHALVCSMPAAVPSIGVTMDERIRNLMAERGTPELALDVGSETLAAELLAALEAVEAEPEAIRAGIEGVVADGLIRMGRMGGALVDELRAHYPELPLRPELGRGGDPLAHLPPLSPAQLALLERAGQAGETEERRHG